MWAQQELLGRMAQQQQQGAAEQAESAKKRAELKVLNAAAASFVDASRFTSSAGGIECPSFSFFVLGFAHVTLIELRLPPISYQD